MLDPCSDPALEVPMKQSHSHRQEISFLPSFPPVSIGPVHLRVASSSQAPHAPIRVEKDDGGADGGSGSGTNMLPVLVRAEMEEKDLHRKPQPLLPCSGMPSDQPLQELSIL